MLGKSPRRMRAVDALPLDFGISAVRAALAGRSLIRTLLSAKNSRRRRRGRFQRLLLVERRLRAISRQSLAGVSSGCQDSAKPGLARRWRGCDAVSLFGLALALGWESASELTSPWALVFA